MRVTKHLIRWLAITLVIVSAGALVYFRSDVHDGVRALQYQPSGELREVVEDASFTWRGKLYFYASQPVFDQTNRASKKCGVEKNSAILGCYADGVIYVYDIDNRELEGVEEVTAAHEMLHAAYARLSERERQSVDKLLAATVRSLEGDKEFSARMTVYDTLSEEDRLNELHSVIATEVRDISGELERYYQQYFHDRRALVEMYHAYSSVFSELEKSLNQMIERYDTLLQRRNELVDSMNQRQVRLTQRIAAVNARDRLSYEEAQAINRDIDRYNQDLEVVRRQVASYDTQLQELKARIESSAAHQQELNQTIDSSLAPAPQL